MSRYSVPAQNKVLTVIVGWDNPLVPHPLLILGYNRFNFVRASSILNCQSTPRCLALVLSAQSPIPTPVFSVVGALATFFAQAFNPAIEDEAEADLLWIGTAFQEIPTVAVLQAQLTGWATIPPAIADCLARDQQAATPPTPLQRWALQLLSDVGTAPPGRA